MLSNLRITIFKCFSMFSYVLVFICFYTFLFVSFLCAYYVLACYMYFLQCHMFVNSFKFTSDYFVCLSKLAYLCHVIFMRFPCVSIQVILVSYVCIRCPIFHMISIQVVFALLFMSDDVHALVYESLCIAYCFRICVQVVLLASSYLHMCLCFLCIAHDS